MTQEFYRGGTRSPFSSKAIGRQFTVPSAANTSPTTQVLVAAPDNEQLRLKRLQLSIMLPKDASAPAMGWFGFVRAPADFSFTVSGVEPDHPEVLRPKTFCTNPDHATYWENYLEAITLDGGGVLYMIVRTFYSNSISACGFTLRFTEETRVRS